ncbi:glycosyltransferase [Streptomyces minutiscleroticus]|uniref:glycosyltransferase n=1 Tax=Streptomyces minutiscleroticus TaxID=68238 RepID=UPI003320E59A
MRVLCTTFGSPSHGRAQLPLLRALVAAGHRVRVVTTSALTPLFEREELPVLTRLPDLPDSSMASAIGDAMPEDPARLTPEEQQRLLLDTLSRAMSGPMARALREAVLPVARDFRPHLVLRDGMDLGVCLAAEELGVPHLPTPSGAANTVDPRALLPGLTALRAEFGLPTPDDPMSVVPHGRVDYVPPSFSFARHLPPSWSYRQTVDVDRGAVLPDWITGLPTDRPLVWAALGTALPMLHERQEGGRGPALPFAFPDPVETLRTIVAAAAELSECTVVVATAGLPVDRADLPPHVHLTERLPQPLLLECADLFLTHGGFNSMREAMRTGTPLAVLPQFGDQHSNAARVEELGLGRHITDRTPSGVAAACRAVLADPGAAATARRARLEMLALPEVSAAVTDLEKIAGETA